MNRYRNRVLTGLTVTLATIAALGASAPARAATTPFITDNGTSAIIATEGPNHTLNSYWQTNNTNPWHEEHIAGIGTTFSAPSVATYSDLFEKLTLVTAEGPDHSLMFYWRDATSATWHQETVIGSNSTYSAPSIAVEGTTTILAVQGPEHFLLYFWQTIDTSAWHSFIVAGAGTTFSAPSIGSNSIAKFITAAGPDNSLMYYWAPPGNFSDWTAQTVNGDFSTYSAPSLTTDSAGVLIAAAGQSNRLMFYWQAKGQTLWHTEVAAGVGTTFSAPSLTDTGARATVAAEGPGNRLSYYWLTNGTTSWHHEAVAGTGTTFSAPGVAFTDVGNSILTHKIANLVTAAGPGNSLLFYWQLGTPAWHREQVAPPGGVG
jgi:hypothetical protein